MLQDLKFLTLEYSIKFQNPIVLFKFTAVDIKTFIKTTSDSRHREGFHFEFLLNTRNYEKFEISFPLRKLLFIKTLLLQQVSFLISPPPPHHVNDTAETKLICLRFQCQWRRLSDGKRKSDNFAGWMAEREL